MGGLPGPVQLSELSQLPVLQVPLPLLLKLQPVRPHIRPLHPDGTAKTEAWPVFRVNPLGKVVAFVMPGHTVSLQSFTTVNVLIVWDEFVPSHQNNVRYSIKRKASAACYVCLCVHMMCVKIKRKDIVLMFL